MNEIERGFTFIELIVAIAIIAILAALTVAGFANYRRRSYDVSVETAIHDVRGSLEAGRVNESIEAGHFMGFSNGAGGQVIGPNVNKYLPGFVATPGLWLMVRYDGWCATQGKKVCGDFACCMIEFVHARHCKGEKAINYVVWNNGETTRTDMPNWACF